MRDFVDWSIWFQRGLEMGHRDRAYSLPVMAWIIAHADNQGTGWGVFEAQAMGSETSQSGEEFLCGLEALHRSGLLMTTLNGQYCVNFEERFEEDAA